MSKRAEPFRPAAGSPSDSFSTAIPSIMKAGTSPFGGQSLPKIRFTRRGRPPTLSRWRMWTYSCCTSWRIQLR
jgi:hypothetical protein